MTIIEPLLVVAVGILAFALGATVVYLKGMFEKNNRRMQELLELRNKNRKLMLEMCDSWKDLSLQAKEGFSEEAKKCTIEAIFQLYGGEGE